MKKLINKGFVIKGLVGKGMAAAGLILITTGLIVAADYVDEHRIIDAAYEEPVAMSSELEGLEADFAAREEAAQVMLAMDSLHRISLTSYDEIHAVRELYEDASEGARNYIDEEQLLAAELAYTELEQQRESLYETAVVNGDLNGILDYSSCNVSVSGNEVLDQLVQDYIEKATTPGMTRSEQVQACYDYMVANYYYAYNYNYSYTDKKSIVWAIAFLRDGYGACNNWNSAFMYIMRALGYDTDLCYGSTASSRGGGVEHYWPIVTIEGQQYIFDPQVEGDMARKMGYNSHARYGLPGADGNGKYYFSTYVE